MASSIAGGLQTMLEAISFAGAGYFLKRFNNNSYEQEIKCHKRALENLV